MNIGFVGLGKMGTGMARNLLRAGHKLTVYNRTREKTEALAKEGAVIADSPAGTAKNADVVFTMLADDKAVDQTVWAKDGLGSALAGETVHISSSTISVGFSRKLAEEHGRRGQKYFSAPVFGRPEAAEAKKLIVVAAGDQKTFERFQSVFDDMGRRTFYVGTEAPQANALKLCGNFMICSMLETFSEALTTIAKAGLERQAFYEVMTELFGSPVYQNYGKTIVERNFDSGNGFGLKLGLKDIRQVLELAQDVASPMPFASIMRDHLLSAVANGQEQMDWSSVELVLARNAGLKTE